MSRQPAAAATRAAGAEAIGRSTRVVLLLAGLYLLALAVRLVVAGRIPVPSTEGSAYYADVARSLVSGEGLVSHAVWSYATGPLVVPKPAFELWLPMSSFVSALAMTLLGTSWSAAQAGGALLGSLVAPLTWAVARGAARAAGLDERRRASVAIGSGILSAVLGPFVLSSAVPDSYTPYLVFSLLAALLVPSWLGDSAVAPASQAGEPSARTGLALGLVLGLAYLSRQEAIWMGLTTLLMLWRVTRTRPPGARLREAARRLGPVAIGGLLVVVPWLARNTLAFGAPFPGQALENMVFVRNEDIFAFMDRPGLATYLGQGLATVLWNPIAAAWAGFAETILMTAFPVGVVGLVSIAALRRSPALRRPTAIVALLGSGGLTFASTVLLFPVATRWGTFLHASGPLVAGLLVMAVLGADALLARVSRARRWRQANVVLGPLTLIVVTTALGLLQVSSVADQSRERQARYAALADAIEAAADELAATVPSTLITDHPMWIADALQRNAIALPDEDLTSLVELSRRFEAPWVVVVDERGRYPAGLLGPAAQACRDGPPLRLESGATPAWLIRLSEACPAVAPSADAPAPAPILRAHTDRRVAA